METLLEDIFKESKDVQTMEDILAVLDQASYGTTPFEDLPNAEKAMIYQKLQLEQEIQSGYIIDFAKAKKWLELIELVYAWALDTTWDFEHRLFFNEGIVEIDSISECCCGEWSLDYRDNTLYLNGENFGDSILHLLNWIESCL